jgi:hypothetical protein
MNYLGTEAVQQARSGIPVATSEPSVSPYSASQPVYIPSYRVSLFGRNNDSKPICYLRRAILSYGLHVNFFVDAHDTVSILLFAQLHSYCHKFHMD